MLNLLFIYCLISVTIFLFITDKTQLGSFYSQFFVVYKGMFSVLFPMELGYLVKYLLRNKI
jgi:hypothetical protein